MPTLSIHDTRKDGWSNAGHDTDIEVDGIVLRLDWGNPELSEELDALLEYMKTL